MTQLGLLEWSPPVVSPTASPQAQNLARVESKQGRAILAWLRARMRTHGGMFCMADLEVAIGGTPGSAGRVMRSLRASGHIEVTNIDRAGSLYHCNRAVEP